MIDFNKEIRRFKPSTEVKDLEMAVANMDITDMRDIELQIISEMLEDVSEKR